MASNEKRESEFPLQGSKAPLGLMAFLSVILVAVLTRHSVEGPLTVFAISAAVSIPALLTSAMFLKLFEDSGEEDLRGSALHDPVAASLAVGCISGYVGLAAVFWSFSAVASLLFIASIPLWSFVFAKYTGLLDRFPFLRRTNER